MRCPHCRTEIRALRRPETCPHCGRSQHGDDGHALRPMDEDFDGLFAELDEQSIRRMKHGTIACTAVALFGLTAFVFPPIAAITAAVILVMQIVWARMLIAVPYARHFSLGRRILTRWLSRLVILALAACHVSGFVPGVQPLLSPPLFAGVCATSWAYHRFHLRREHRHEPVHILEKLLLGLVVVFLLTVIVLFVVFFSVISQIAKGGGPG